ncbi:nuclear transport factor 2 family protein [Actinomadura soli]|uniref:Nuclear transport factor 2 family protein n=1 Tax=Actinomadura soli TaxID=2508997 RepID=A0A5C4J7V0_9ACTN|nr:nuclear transport factor 2 family protein [Actinomadura soli]TMQ94807.1 nuclear transport factor 2 family protein [Actinomadura soli]
MSPGAATALVDRYLQLCEDRKLDEAGALLAPGARLVFPGDRVYTTLTEMAAGSAARHRWVRKERERYFEGVADGGAATVTSLGTLYGEDPAGRPFSGVRYADVFVLRDGLIVEQHVYNDLAVAGIGAAPAAEDPGTPA